MGQQLGRRYGKYACRRIYVIYPGEQVCKLLSLMGIADDFYYYKKTLGNELEGLRITPIKVSHALDMECFGYEIQCEKQRKSVVLHTPVIFFDIFSGHIDFHTLFYIV